MGVLGALVSVLGLNELLVDTGKLSFTWEFTLETVDGVTVPLSLVSGLKLVLKAELVDSVWPNAETGIVDSVVEAKFVVGRFKSVVNSLAKVDVCVPSELVLSTEKLPVVWVLELEPVEKTEDGVVIDPLSLFDVSGFQVERRVVESKLTELVDSVWPNIDIELPADPEVKGKFVLGTNVIGISLFSVAIESVVVDRVAG